MSAQWVCGPHTIDLSMPILMGIVNVTPDSFSDGGSYDNVYKALERAQQLIADGAIIIDVGGESTRPGSAQVSAEDEIDRVVPVIKALSKRGVIVSVDTRHASVAQAAVDAGAVIINDIEGFRNPAMVAVAVATSTGLVVMHMAGTPETMQQNPQYEDVVAEVSTYLCGQATMLERAGVAPNRICLDSGFGFGKTYEHNLLLLAGQNRIAAIGYPVLIGVSRKAMIGRLSGITTPAQRDVASAQVALDLCLRGALVVRAHEVALTERLLHDARTNEPPTTVAYIALGSNLGDTATNIKSAIALIAKIPATRVIAQSSNYTSEPAYVTDQPLFTNAVISVETELGLYALFAELQAIEFLMGRVKEIDKGPRNIDVDLIAFGAETSNTPELMVPHPLAQERDFVVTPLREIAPDYVFPDGVPVAKCTPTMGRIV